MDRGQRWSRRGLTTTEIRQDDFQPDDSKGLAALGDLDKQSCVFFSPVKFLLS